MMQMSELIEKVGAYRTARMSAEAAVRAAFPVGTKVAIGSKTSYLRGVVHSFIGGAPDEIGVLFDSGNTWSYPVEKLHRID
jgi:hypothetical protein